MSERVWRNVQESTKKQGLATGSHSYKSPNDEHVPSMLEVEVSCQLEHYRTKNTDWPFSYLTAGTRNSVKPLASSVLKNLTLHIPFSLQYKYPLYPRNIESFQREYWKRNPREKQDWLIHNLHIETLQIPLLLSSPLLHAWEVHYQNLFSPYPHLWEGHLVLGKQLGRDQFHIDWYYGL